MSALGSSVISKSSKQFGPKKASARRSATRTQLETSSRDESRRSTTDGFQPLFEETGIDRPLDNSGHGASSVGRASQRGKGHLKSVQDGRTTDLRDPPARAAPAYTCQSVLPADDSRLASAHATSASDRARSPRQTLSRLPSKDYPGSGARAQVAQPGAGDDFGNSVSSEPQFQRAPIALASLATAVDAHPSKRRRIGSATKKVNSRTSTTIGAAVPVATTEIDSEHLPREAKKSRRRAVNGNKSEANQASSAELDGIEESSTSIGRSRRQLLNHQSDVNQRHWHSDHNAVAITDATVEDFIKSYKSRGRKPKRPTTPEDGDSTTILPAEAKMLDLCSDNGFGRKSLRELELREMERASRVAKMKEELQRKQGRPQTPAEEHSVGRSRLMGLSHTEAGQAAALNVPRTIIVNGQIQVDEASLQIDRHAAASLKRDDEDLEALDENDLTHKVTAGSYMKKDKNGGWNGNMQDLFYQGLRMFGTDFELISKMFPGKSRHTIKRKFCKEERENYPRIKAALTGIPFDGVLEEYERLTGREYEDPSNVDRMMEEDRRIIEEEQAAEKEALEASAREREEQAAVERQLAEEARADADASESNLNHPKRPRSKMAKKRAQPAKSKGSRTPRSSQANKRVTRASTKDSR